jgi:succinate dehydrogenase / fumarate reductase cytochrome b subunit
MTAASTQGVRRSDPAFLRARLGSLLAVAPLGIWTVVHLWHNLAAFRGAEEWQRDVTEYPHRLAFFVSSLVALLPLGIHTVWGIGRLFTVRPNNVRYRTFANLKYILQRASAVGVVFFLGAHVYEAMIHPRALEGHAETFEDIAHHMHSHAPTLIVYVLGVLGVSYHLANGLHSFAMGWGIVSSRRALKKLEALALLTFVVLLAMGWGVVYALYDAGT